MRNYIDALFRSYGENYFGKAVMNKINDAQLEQARIKTFKDAENLTKKYGKLKDGSIKEIFYKIIQTEYLKEA